MGLLAAMHINAHRSILVVGGAGFIGSHMVIALHQAGYRVIVLDNLSHGHRQAILHAELVIGDLNDKFCLKELFTQHQFFAVIHFANLIDVAESVMDPAKYYQNNVVGTLNLLDAMLAHNVDKFIFSSSAAVYGEPQYFPIDEQHPLLPINPYGRAKRMTEEIIQDYAKSYGLRYAIFRYFNAAGADPSGRVGEMHRDETHLIPLALQVALGTRKVLTINGNDYLTADGTCIRDYVHVNDLCDAHLQAIEALHKNHPNMICNLGSSHGYSVQEVLTTVRLVTGHDIPIIIGPRRPGDPAKLVANASLAKRMLHWQPKYNDLTVMVKHSWQFFNN